jgi:hypothetical protein
MGARVGAAAHNDLGVLVGTYLIVAYVLHKGKLDSHAGKLRVEQVVIPVLT